MHAMPLGLSPTPLRIALSLSPALSPALLFFAPAAVRATEIALLFIARWRMMGAITTRTCLGAPEALRWGQSSNSESKNKNKNRAKIRAFYLAPILLRSLAHSLAQCCARHCSTGQVQPAGRDWLLVLAKGGGESRPHMQLRDLPAPAPPFVLVPFPLVASVVLQSRSEPAHHHPSFRSFSSTPPK
jgi:hypothetical protein